MPDRHREPGACPHCDTALRPEPIAPGIWLCPCCASVFRVPTAEHPQGWGVSSSGDGSPSGASAAAGFFCLRVGEFDARREG